MHRGLHAGSLPSQESLRKSLEKRICPIKYMGDFHFTTARK
jgi:hypothetical protein